MNILEAINHAKFRGGYNPKEKWEESTPFGDIKKFSVRDIINDDEFWLCLGKAARKHILDGKDINSFFEKL